MCYAHCDNCEEFTTVQNDPEYSQFWYCSNCYVYIMISQLEMIDID